MATNISRDFVSLTTDWYMTFTVDPMLDLGQATLREVTRCVRALRVVMTEEQSKDFDLSWALTWDCLCLYLHLLNRTAFRFGHEVRCKFQEELTNKCFPFFGQVLCSANDEAANAEFCDVLLSDVNETEMLYGSKRTIADKDLSDEAVLTAFGKSVCLSLGRPSDELAMIGVQIAVLESLNRARFAELIARWQEQWREPIS